MGREIRRVPADWKHPTRDGLDFVALFDGADFARRLSDWEAGAAKWAEGLRDDYNGGWMPIGDVEAKTWADWYGQRPDPADYMPQWANAERTHLMMYETCSEGTPISPALATPEEVARWCADNGASAFGYQTASYEAWLSVAQGGWAPSAVYTPATGLVSGVEANLAG